LIIISPRFTKCKLFLQIF